jgi:hypothetical protein
MSRLLTGVWNRTPRPFSDHRTTEPLTYRGWKWLWQQRSKIGWESNLFERIEDSEWDVLVILDACRYDTLAAVVDCAVVERAISPASATPGFLKQAKDTDLFNGTTYLSANPQTDAHPPGAESVVDLYETEWDAELSTVPPPSPSTRRPNNDCKAAIGLSHTHCSPTIHTSVRLETRYDRFETVFILLNSTSSTGPIWNHKYSSPMGRFRSTVPAVRIEHCTAYAWNRVKAFATWATSNEYTVAITADHGELFGERGFVEHPVKMNVAPLTTVPWLIFEPDITPPAYELEHQSDNVTDRLAALGYVE